MQQENGFIDIHCHLLFGLDDGSGSIETSLAMARMALADGTELVLCTPHITPGIYDNTASRIDAALSAFRQDLDAASIGLAVAMGADVHMAPDLLPKLRAGEIPTLAGSRYFLFEPPHHVLPPRMEQLLASLLEAGYVPILTHPERLSWVEQHYDLIRRLSAMGIPMQLTAGSITGRFGPRIRQLSERMLDDGLVDIIASDGHNLTSRPPSLSAAHALVAARLGQAEADAMMRLRPSAIVANADLPARPGPSSDAPQKQGRQAGWAGWFRRGEKG
ncbi:protein-tyrosine phosphatase [Devosia enhydra]|uniref:protein-tyrosine-phosphatase n=1 Tax=Devosia enhydra TaxID=665118 RepID=A0A1K2HS97_9HYPH|nr:CpsB/CapC family capsule biosynthesis tyrosine phosphatase [Devosia enhydra]SFZ80651.1 protein-tyrosine phosphatase [Devosia enhydra]